MPNRLLFLVKRRAGYWGLSPYGDAYSDDPGYASCRGTGLWNSARFVVEMLIEIGIDAKIVEVQDNNAIDREVTAYRPTHCILEAFWVVPEKFDVLMPLHPDVQWIVRDHSETPFLAQEGSPFSWVPGLMQRGVEIMCNSRRAQHDMQTIARDLDISPEIVTYGPNHYPLGPFHLPPMAANDNCCCDPLIKVSCFGAVRPLKNHMTQAIAALEFARRIGRELRFHINAGRVEGGGGPALRSMRAILGHRLVEHPWMEHDEFVAMIATMDLSLQVSFSETFNIVTADAVQGLVPVVVSSEVPWLSSYAHADPTDAMDIAHAMERAWCERIMRAGVQWAELFAWNSRVAGIWLERFGHAEAAIFGRWRHRRAH